MATIFSDDFNRADNSTLGNNWVKEAGTWAVSSNQLSGSSANCVLYNTTSLASANYKITVKCKKTTSDDGGSGIVARRTASNTFYLVQLDWTNNVIQLYKQVSGSWTQITTASSTINAGTFYTIKFELNGTAIKVYVTNLVTPIIDTSDSTISNAGTFGLRNGGGTTDYVYDDYLVEDLVTTPTTSIKKLMGVVIASVKRTHSLAIASVKKISGVANA